MTEVDTKEKIMEAARILFADNGFEGTSIREIAKSAEVNVASVNYYFSSKENLFHEILQKGYVECSVEMKNLFEKNEGNLENTLVDFLLYFIENSHDLMTHFKMMMSSQHSHKIVSSNSDDGLYGPPGGIVIAEALRRDCPTISEENLHWALRTLFSHVSHITIIHTCCLKSNQDLPFSTVEDLKKSVKRITRLVLSELKASPHSANSL